MFGYLHIAWTEIGFTHGDLNCANVMEHRGDAEPYLPKGFSDSEDKANKAPLFKLPGTTLCSDAQRELKNACVCLDKSVSQYCIVLQEQHTDSMCKVYAL